MGWMKRVNIQWTDEWIFNMCVWFFARNDRKSLASDRCLSYLKKNSKSLVLPTCNLCLFGLVWNISPFMEAGVWLMRLKTTFTLTLLISDIFNLPWSIIYTRKLQTLGARFIWYDFVESIGKICMERSSWFAQAAAKHKQNSSLNALCE